MTISTPVVANPQHDASGQSVLSVVIVNYNGWDDVHRLISALCLSPCVASGLAEVLVVDNASPEPMPDDFLPLPAGSRLIQRPDNGGFAVGVNEGWRASRCPWLLVLNPDVVAEPDLVGQILDRIRSYEARETGPPGIVGYALKNPDGSSQPSVGAFPSLFRTVREQLIPRSRRKYQPDWLVRPGPVPWVTGACVLMCTQTLEELGGMDEDFFLYHEEVALCRSATDAGWTVEFDPSISVVHLRPLQNRAISPKMRLVTRHSKLLYFLKHLPKQQFTWLCLVIGTEARIRGWAARLSGATLEARAWRAIGRMTRLMRQGKPIVGAQVRDVAEHLADDEPTDQDWISPATVKPPGLQASERTNK